MIRFHRFALAAGCLVALGCVETRAITTPGADLGRYRSFAFAQPAEPQSVELARSPAGQTIRSEIERALADHGVVMNNENPDFRVAYYLVIDEKDASPYTSPFGPLYWSSPGSVDYLRGTIVIDFVDPQTQGVFWRGTASSIVDHPENPNLHKVAVAVDKVMRRVPRQFAAAGVPARPTASAAR